MYEKETPWLRQLGQFIADKLYVHRDFDVDSGAKDDNKVLDCKDAPKMITALLLELFLGPLGAGWGYMERWDYFAMEFVTFLTGPIVGCLCVCATCFSINGHVMWKGGRQGFDELVDEEGNARIEKMHSDAACGFLAVICFICLWSIATVAIQLWSIINIANKSIKSGNGCPLQD